MKRGNKMFKYFPHTEEDIKLMLKKLNLNSLDELFKDVPEKIIKDGKYNIEDGISEYELIKEIKDIANMNKSLKIYRGAGAYDHYTPAVIPYLVSRGEFTTSYTPYQPEVSQGTLQYIFEFQSYVCELTGMDVSNASVYDGATAAAEAMFMASGATRKNKILVSKTVNPRTIDVITSYAHFRDIEIVFIDELDGVTTNDFDVADIAGIIVQYPNYYGIVEDYKDIIDKVHEAKGLVIMISDLQSLAVLKSPGDLGADIVVGDGQSLGIPLQFGGPYVGYMATTKRLTRRLPGRICGVTKDVDGKRAFVLTLQAREQHIRREKATSNICSNQSLMALWVTIYLSIMGKDGMSKINEICYNNAKYLKDKLLKTKRFKEIYKDKPFIKEFVLEADFNVEEVEEDLLDKGYLTGLHIGDNKLLFAVTEKYNKDEIDKFVEVLENVIR